MAKVRRMRPRFAFETVASEEKGFAMFKLRFAFAVGLAVWCSDAFAHEERGTPEQRAACTPDALLLCASYIPDPTRVESCLRQHRADLSQACRAVFENGSATAVVKVK